jgi:magnesium transporter
MCLIFAKSGVELLLLTLEGHNQFNRWETWILVLGLGIFALLQLWYLHKSLVLADPTLVCPREYYLALAFLPSLTSHISRILLL